LAYKIWSVELHHCAKFHRNWSIHSGEITIFQLFKMAAAAILDFINSPMLFTNGLWRAKMYQLAKFRQNPSFRCGAIVIFQFFKMADAAILYF